ncbi:mRNA export factor [Trichinella spiralis]|uniref:mRNA export factor n=1 Tax=Trichinella spiralis TaxID=6334 RepID=UPI0001EFC3DC|nr:mRNA export factor [Trichinella spiralis]
MFCQLQVFFDLCLSIMFSSLTSSALRPTSTPFAAAAALSSSAGAHNPNKDFEVVQPPDDTVQALKFSPPALAQNFLVSGSWDNVLRVWEVKQDGSTEPKAEQRIQGPVMQVDWSDVKHSSFCNIRDGTKIFVASADRQVRVWDVSSNQMATIGQHDQTVSTCNWVHSPTYSCLITGSWDKTVKFWDMRTPNTPAGVVSMPERVYFVDVLYPMGVACLANREIKIYKLDGQPVEVKSMESPLKYQTRSVSIFKDKTNGAPVGYAVGSLEGRVAIQYVETVDPKANFTFKCHRSPELVNGFQEIYSVNDIAFHPQHGTLATVGSDGRYSFWDKDARTKLKMSEKLQNSITRCCFNKTGDIFAYAVGYDWSKGHEFHNPQTKNYIFLHACFEDLKPRMTKSNCFLNVQKNNRDLDIRRTRRQFSAQTTGRRRILMISLLFKASKGANN